MKSYTIENISKTVKENTTYLQKKKKCTNNIKKNNKEHIISMVFWDLINISLTVQCTHFYYHYLQCQVSKHDNLLGNYVIYLINYYTKNQ